jgi:rod shape determining protein RodA
VQKIFVASGTLSKGNDALSKKIFLFNNLKNINKKVIFIFLILLFAGIINLFGVSQTHAFKQLFYCVAFVPFFIFIVVLNPRYFIKFAYIIFIASVLLLLSIFIIGDVFMGARRWINLKLFQFQPSEFAKIAIIIFIARYYHFLKESEIFKLKSALIPLIVLVIQVILILKQPDLGSAITLTLIAFSVIFLAGLRIRYFIIGFLMAIALIPVIWSNLHDYQKSRVRTFLNPEADILGAGYNIQQAKIAIGSGGFLGKGIFEGTQGVLEFLPESHTDFAFTIFAEQFGLVGSIALLLLYSYLLYFGFSIAVVSESHFIRLVAGGISCMIFFHIIINLAMTTGLIPVVGNPLPLISYGGTFLISNLICFAILINCDLNKSIVIHSSSESYMEK